MPSLPTIPTAGLREVLSSWSGEGQLWDALAAVEDEETLAERRWSPRDLQRRARRVLFTTLLPQLQLWPADVQDWIDALPAETQTRKEVTRRPVRGTAWAETRRRFGWPPSDYVTRVRERISDEFLLTTFLWTLERVLETREDAVRLAVRIDEPVNANLAAAEMLLETGALEEVEAVEPSRADVEAVGRSGSPWNVVAPIASGFLRLEISLFDLARELIRPDEEEFAWRLFHLGVFGQVLLSLRSLGADLRSRAPISGGSAGPAYEVLLPDGEAWDLWFEAAGAWGYYARKSPYAEASSSAPGATRALGADVLLIRLDERALLLECKFSPDPSTVARNGYHQAASYALEVRSRLANETVACIVGPDGVLTGTSSTDAFAALTSIRVTMAPASEVDGVVRHFLEP